MTAPERIAGLAGVRLLVTADHASAAVPHGVELGVSAAAMATHIAIDIGTAELARRLAARLGAPAVIATVSRLVIDFNREPDATGLIPHISDGVHIIGNDGLPDGERTRRLNAYHAPYHATIDAAIAETAPAMLVSIHSFTPQLATRPDEVRPWPVGVLYNVDDRAARLGIAALAARGWNVGDNQPYSGRVLNATMNRHAEARGLPYLGFEVRQDQLGDAAGIAAWADILADVVSEVAAQMFSRSVPAPR
ncbi:N-formylglutamate amidohydrolase [Polymorphobacter arshaanensis]|uniref:N-formylglutamate amidohydrolase n=1 Tax=Glacieibacterium arshaanense TaxID=2511025 RepID=A0A4Y9ES04_9SPHN|nr:N-formylglutamate amidohydrolase [Polymorphobacter arshaanensis]TFU06384.1 N-formylglutamate amidohydrolase [Polymorphobacter arshaanensis]